MLKMILRISDKLGRKIKEKPSKVLPLDSNPYADWTARLFTESRAQYIMISNTTSLYSMVMFGKGITDDFTFKNRVTSHMSEYIREDGFRLIFERLIMLNMNVISLSKALSRSVTGSMNDLEFQAKTILCGGTVSPWDLSNKLNEIPFSYLKYKRPKDMFPAMSI